MLVNLHAIRQARANLAGVTVPTPLRYNETFSDISGSHVYLKPESLQRTGSFKLRGAYNKIANLPVEAREQGVIAFSAGNHGAGTACAAQELGVSATVVMPDDPVKFKEELIAGFGATVVYGGTTSITMMERAQELAAEHGYTMIHPFDDPYTIAGQGTIGLEILDDLPEVEAVLVPVSGGGLISGIATAVKEVKPTVKVIGVNTEGAPAMFESLKAGQPTEVDVDTIADGLMAKKPGDLTLQHVEKYVDDVVLVSEADIARTVGLLAAHAKLVVEPSGAAALAALLAGRVKLPGRLVVPVVSGGNVDLATLAGLLTS